MKLNLKKFIKNKEFIKNLINLKYKKTEKLANIINISNKKKLLLKKKKNLDPKLCDIMSKFNWIKKKDKKIDIIK